MSVLWAQSLVSNRTGKPRVQLHHQDWMVQVTPEEARQWAMSILRCAEAAEQDAFLVSWIRDHLGGEYEAGLQLLVEYRAYREAQQKKESADGAV